MTGHVLPISHSAVKTSQCQEQQPDGQKKYKSLKL